MDRKKTIIVIAAASLLFVAVVVVFLIFKKPDNAEITVPDETTVSTSVTTAPVTEATTEVTTYPPFVNGLSLKAQEAKQSNSDTVGWIRISNTVIDYPLVRASENDYYVYRDFYGNENPAGWIFMDYRCLMEPDFISDNVLLYGHNMADGSMFSDIKNYQRYESFYEENPIVEVSSLYADYQYKIFAFMLCNGVKGSDFEFWNYTVFQSDDSEWSLPYYLSKIDEKSLIQTNVDVRDGDKLLLLSTCANGDTTDPTRFVVLARMVRPGEDAYEGTTGSVRR